MLLCSVFIAVRERNKSSKRKLKLMLRGVLIEYKVIAQGAEAREFYEKGWYGELKDGKLVLHLIEAALLVERERLKVFKSGKELSLKDIFDIGVAMDRNFPVKFLVYKDLRTRGLPVRIAGEDADFFVYERGSKPAKHSPIKWIVFAYSENDLCSLDELERTAKIGKNIRAKSVWAIVDGDNDITYYIVSMKTEL